MPFKEGEQVGPYRVMEQLGRGGMATVFKAYHANLDRYVALKVLHPAFMEDPNFEARFQREARVVAKLEHPNIIPIYDFSEHDGRSYLVMKFVEGETLKARLQKHPLTPDEGVEIIEAVGKGLSYAHKQGILHRDIKPSNVMLSNDGQVFLTDFGLARIASAGESTLSSDMMIGTPQYISPEQAVGKRDLDEGTDIYSFGVLMYELVVGQVPFSSDTPFSIVHDHIYAPLPLPRTVNPNVPESMERILLKALAKEREDRFDSVASMVKAFKQAVQGETMPESWADPTLQVARAQVAETETFTPPAASPDDSTIPPGDMAPIKEKKRVFKKWMWIPIGLMACFCSLVTLNAIRENRQSGAQVETVVFIADDGNTDNVADVAAEEAPPPAPLPESDAEKRAALESAQKNVDENPEDPFAYLDLAVVYIDLGDEGAALETFAQGQELAGDNLDYFVVAGDLLAARERWLLALEQYLKAYELGFGDGDRVFFNKVSQAAYFAAADPTAEEFFTRNRVIDRTNEIAQAVQARFVALHGSPEEALGMIEDALRLRPETALYRLVHAEILKILGDIDPAMQILQELIDQDTTPPWIKIEARKMLNEIRQ